MLIEPYSNGVVSGSRFDLSAEDVLDYCTPETALELMR
jgi:hypothetical protein